jgi:STE24 endopeptidase
MRLSARLRTAPAWIAVAVVLLGGVCPGIGAQEAPPAEEPAQEASAPEEPADADAAPAEPATSAEPAPAAAVPFDPEVATRAYLDRLSPEEKARSDAYFEGGYWLQLWGLLYGLGVAWLFLGTGLSARMRDLAERIAPWGPLRTALFALQYLVVAAVLGFPLTVYTGFLREHQYDLATQGFGGWLRDWAVGLLVSLVLMSFVFLPVLYGVIRKAPRTWWVWGTGVAVVFLSLGILIAPVYIDPLFNKYEALADPEVREPILSLARANGVPADEVWEFDASRQTTRISANVSGFAGTMRVRLNDNLLERCTLPEILAVMGHELGHYVLNHIYELIVYIALVLAGGFAFVHWGFGRALARWGGRWRVRGVSDVAGLPLLGALLSIYMFVMTPVLNSIIRVNEAEADLFGLNAAREPEGFAEVALKLGEYRKLEPGAVEEWIFFDHPSGRSRIRMAMRWKAEHLEGEPSAAGGP